MSDTFKRRERDVGGATPDHPDEPGPTRPMETVEAPQEWESGQQAVDPISDVPATRQMVPTVGAVSGVTGKVNTDLLRTVGGVSEGDEDVDVEDIIGLLSDCDLFEGLSNEARREIIRASLAHESNKKTRKGYVLGRFATPRDEEFGVPAQKGELLIAARKQAYGNQIRPSGLYVILAGTNEKIPFEAVLTGDDREEELTSTFEIGHGQAIGQALFVGQNPTLNVRMGDKPATMFYINPEVFMRLEPRQRRLIKKNAILSTSYFKQHNKAAGEQASAVTATGSLSLQINELAKLHPPQASETLKRWIQEKGVEQHVRNREAKYHGMRVKKYKGDAPIGLPEKGEIAYIHRGSIDVFDLDKKAFISKIEQGNIFGERASVGGDPTADLRANPGGAQVVYIQMTKVRRGDSAAGFEKEGELDLLLESMLIKIGYGVERTMRTNRMLGRA